MEIFIDKIDNKNDQNKIKNLSFNKDLLNEANIIYNEMAKYSLMIIYIANFNLPNTSAYSHHVMKMCDI